MAQARILWQCTIHHILVNCPFALDQARYTWRHDSVLKNIERALEQGLQDFNHRKPSVFAEVARKDFQPCFVREGVKPKKVPNRSNGMVS